MGGGERAQVSLRADASCCEHMETPCCGHMGTPCCGLIGTPCCGRMGTPCCGRIGTAVGSREGPSGAGPGGRPVPWGDLPAMCPLCWPRNSGCAPQGRLFLQLGRRRARQSLPRAPEGARAPRCGPESGMALRSRARRPPSWWGVEPEGPRRRPSRALRFCPPCPAVARKNRQGLSNPEPGNRLHPEPRPPDARALALPPIPGGQGLSGPPLPGSWWPEAGAGLSQRRPVVGRSGWGPDGGGCS